MVVENKRPIIIATIAAGLLLIPFVAMQFTSEVNWNLMDFLVAGALLFGFGAALELTLRVIKKRAHRILAGAAILFFLVLIWAELAVGIFGTPLAGS